MWCTIGHEKAASALKRSVGEGRASHAYLIVGPRQVGKMTLALDLARLVNCLGSDLPCGQCPQCRRIAEGLHADVRVVGIELQKGAEGRSRTQIGIDQVRDLQREASLKPYEGRCRVFIVDGAEALSEEAANSLLKTLEEPPEQVIIVLLACDAGALLPTILSRCQRLDLKPLPLDQLARELESRYGLGSAEALELARLSGGRPGWALLALEDTGMLEQRAHKLEAIESAIRDGLEGRFAYAEALSTAFSKDRESVRLELALWLQWWRDVLLTREGVPQFITNLSREESLKAYSQALSPAEIAAAIQAVSEALDNLQRNVNSRLALEAMMLAMPRL